MAKTVNVNCPVSLGIIMRLYRKLPPPDFHMAPDPAHEAVTLRAGTNAGVDKAFFVAWADQNPDLVTRLGITSEDEEEAASAAQQEDDEHGS